MNYEMNGCAVNIELLCSTILLLSSVLVVTDCTEELCIKLKKKINNNKEIKHPSSSDVNQSKKYHVHHVILPAWGVEYPVGYVRGGYRGEVTVELAAMTEIEDEGVKNEDCNAGNLRLESRCANKGIFKSNLKNLRTVCLTVFPVPADAYFPIIIRVYVQALHASIICNTKLVCVH